MKAQLTLLVAIVACACLFVPRVDAVPNDTEAVRIAVSGFATTWNRHDMPAFGKLFAVDADFVTVAGSWMKGRDEIQMHHAYMHGTIPSNTFSTDHSKYYAIFKNSSMHFNSIVVRFVRRDVAIARVQWELDGDSRTSIPRRGLLMFVLARQGGAWLITAAQNTEINRPIK